VDISHKFETEGRNHLFNGYVFLSLFIHFIPSVSPSNSGALSLRQSALFFRSPAQALLACSRDGNSQYVFFLQSTLLYSEAKLEKQTVVGKCNTQSSLRGAESLWNKEFVARTRSYTIVSVGESMGGGVAPVVYLKSLSLVNRRNNLRRHVYK
jgi:hypothetical protein